jgi:glucose-1-phosphate adenylyltransferase
LIADGCKIGNDVTIENSVIGLRTVIGDNVTIKDSVVMGADFIEREEPSSRDRLAGRRRLRERRPRAILDKNCRIGTDVKITNARGVENQGEDERSRSATGSPS